MIFDKKSIQFEKSNIEKFYQNVDKKMDIIVMFATVFSTVYTLYMKWYKFFNPQPKQLFSFDRNQKKLFTHGFIGYTPCKISLNYFAIKGTYDIEVNGSRLISFVDNVLEGTEIGYTYYLGNNYVQAQEDMRIRITDTLLETFGTKIIKKGEIIDFGKLIRELLPDDL